MCFSVSSGATKGCKATVVTIGMSCISPTCLSSPIPRLTRRFLRERINLWEQLNHITLCKYPIQPPLFLDHYVSFQPYAPLAQKCTRGKLTFALIVCKWQLVLAIEMKHWPMQEKIFERWVINNSSGRAVTFACRGRGSTEWASSGTFKSKLVFFIGKFIFLYAFGSNPLHFYWPALELEAVSTTFLTLHW